MGYSPAKPPFNLEDFLKKKGVPPSARRRWKKLKPAAPPAAEAEAESPAPDEVPPVA